jgi:hypothetical protein
LTEKGGWTMLLPYIDDENPDALYEDEYVEFEEEDLEDLEDEEEFFGMDEEEY